MGCAASTQKGTASSSKVSPDEQPSQPPAEPAQAIPADKPAAQRTEVPADTGAQGTETTAAGDADAGPAKNSPPSASSPPGRTSNGEGTAMASGSTPPAPARISSSVLPKHVSQDELGQLCQATNFDRKQVERLYEVFKVISATAADDGMIDKVEFETALGLRPSLFTDRMFVVFDKNNDRRISFDEFVHSLSVFSARASREAKAEFAFRIYDIDGDGIISREELSRMLRVTIEENALAISDEQFEQLIDTTFEQAGAVGATGLDLEAYLKLVVLRPGMLGNMTIPSLTVSR